MNPSHPADPGSPTEHGHSEMPPPEARSGEGAESALQRLKELERRLPGNAERPQQ
jgi:hypothetical protein